MQVPSYETATLEELETEHRRLDALAAEINAEKLRLHAAMELRRAAMLTPGPANLQQIVRPSAGPATGLRNGE